MRDFSKSIMIGNAYKKFERKYEENGNKIMEIVEVGVIIYLKMEQNMQFIM